MVNNSVTRRWLHHGCVWLTLLTLISVSWRSAQAQGTPTPDTISTIIAELTLTAQGALPSAAPANLTPSPTSPLLVLTPVLGLTSAATAQTGPSYIKIGTPPFTLNLPAGWKQAYFAVSSSDTLAQGTFVKVALYQGPLPNGVTGTIVALWGYSSISADLSTPLPGTPTPAVQMLTAQQRTLFGDGQRLLQSVVVDVSCNVAHYGLRQDFTVGKQAGIGQLFAAVQCADEPDSIGWYVGVQQEERDYLFYALIDPPSEINRAMADMQAVLDTVQFVPLAQYTLTPQPTPALVMPAATTTP